MQPRALHVRVEDPDVDDLRARPIRLVGDQSHQLELLRLSRDEHHLIRLNVRSEANGELGDSLFASRHRRRTYSESESTLDDRARAD